MTLKSILRDGLGSISRRSFEPWKRERERERSASSSIFFGDIGPDGVGGEGHIDEGIWAGLPPELMREVVNKMEQSDSVWPARRNIVACASVCRSWRHVSKEIVGAPETTGKLTFPLSLKQPGPRSAPIQCYIKRNKSTSTYQLFVGLNPENGKFLLAARKIRSPTHAEFIISMVAEDFSRSNAGYIGKLRSNFLGTKFVVYDSQPPYSGAVSSTGRSSSRFYSRKVSPKVPSGSYGIAHIAFELNMLGSRGPRRMCCTMHSIPVSALEANGTVPSYYNHSAQPSEESFSRVSLSRLLDDTVGEDVKSSDSAKFTGSTGFTELSVDVVGKQGSLILKNKAPRWHDQLQCWCLNFRGRVTVASVKNFQLVAAAASGEPAENSTAETSVVGGSSDHEKIILQFGKIGKDVFTMDYRYPLSAFQAFGICLSSFDTKLACE